MSDNKIDNKIIQEAQRHDEAFLNSFLSYGVYTSRKWTLTKDDENDDIENPVLRALKRANVELTDISNKKAYELYMSFFMKQKFEPVNLGLIGSVNYTSDKYGYNTVYNSDVGDYETLNNLARAGIYRSKKPDGTYTLHLAFRGTDKEARPFLDFVRKAYLDMSAYYDAFKPLEEAVLAYAKDPKNKISEMHISGHSLGGSMVSEFFNSPAVQECSIPKKGFTYGAPGSTKKTLYEILPSLYHCIKHKKFMALGETCIKFLSYDFIFGFSFGNNDFASDDRIVQYSHAGDLIPRVAAATYLKQGIQVPLKDVASMRKKDSIILNGQIPLAPFHKEKVKNIIHKTLKYTRHYLFDKPADFFKKAVCLDFHDMLRYTINIEHHAEKLMYTNFKGTDLKVKTAELMPHLQEFSEYKKKFEKATSFVMPANDVLTEKMLANKNVITLNAPSNNEVSQAIAKMKRIMMGKAIVDSLSDKPLEVTFVSKSTGNVLKKL